MSVYPLQNYDIQGISTFDEAFTQLKVSLLDLLDMCEEPIIETADVVCMDANLTFVKGYFERLETLTEQQDECNPEDVDTEMFG